MSKKKITVKVSVKYSPIRFISQTPIVSTEASMRRPKLNSTFYSASPFKNPKLSSKNKRVNSNYKCIYLKEDYMKNYKKLSPVLNKINFTTPDEHSIDSEYITSLSLKSNVTVYKSKEVKSMITRLANFNILQMKKQSLQEKLNIKNRRFNLRQRKTVKGT